MTKVYEIDLWLRKTDQPLSEEVIESLREEITRADGEILKDARFSKRRLAYPIKKESEGNFGTIFAQLLPESVARLQEKLRSRPEVLRLGIFEHETKEPLTPRRVSRRPRKPVPQVPETKMPLLEELDKKLEEILKT